MARECNIRSIPATTRYRKMNKSPPKIGNCFGETVILRKLFNNSTHSTKKLAQQNAPAPTGKSPAA